MMLNLENISFSYDNLEILNNFNESISKNKTTVILGPSGCGKTTLLNLISGSITPKSGEITCKTDPTISYIYQEPRLMPWKTVEQNIIFVLDKLNPKERELRCNHYLQELEMTDFKNYYPHQLSGGMKQRCSIARAFAYPSDLMLLDEPFKGLDISLKYNLIKLFNRINNRDNRTSIFVTHDIQEAILIGDEILVLSRSPVKIINKYINKVPPAQRIPGEKNLLGLEKSLYSDLLSNRT